MTRLGLLAVVIALVWGGALPAHGEEREPTIKPGDLFTGLDVLSLASGSGEFLKSLEYEVFGIDVVVDGRSQSNYAIACFARGTDLECIKLDN